MSRKIVTAILGGAVLLSACARGPAPSVLYEERLSRLESRVKQLEQRYEPPARESARLSIPASLSQKELDAMLVETTGFRKILARYPADTFTGKLRIQELRARATALDAKLKAADVEKNMALKRERQLYLYQEFQQLRNDMAAVPKSPAATTAAPQKKATPMPPLAAPGRSTLSVPPTANNAAGVPVRSTAPRMKQPSTPGKKITPPPSTTTPTIQAQPAMRATPPVHATASPPQATPVPASQRGEGATPPLPSDPGRFSLIPAVPPQTVPPQTSPIPATPQGKLVAPPLPDDPGKFAPIPPTPGPTPPPVPRKKALPAPTPDAAASVPAATTP